MKMMLQKLGLGCLLIAVMQVSVQAEIKVGTVSLAKVFDGYWKTKQADTALKDRQAELKTNQGPFRVRANMCTPLPKASSA